VVGVVPIAAVFVAIAVAGDKATQEITANQMVQTVEVVSIVALSWLELPKMADSDQQVKSYDYSTVVRLSVCCPKLIEVELVNLEAIFYPEPEF
jgi:hypothetical protein